jgi:oxygen-independent coproporphyrinogen-3 oxidase
MVAAAGDTLGLYISIPFCRSKCTYCNFASGVYPASDHERYVNRLIEDLRTAREWAERTGADLPRRVDTIYLGGGTPSLLEPELVERLLAAMRTEFDVDADAEITVECAPGQLADDILQALAAAGVNRVSLGVQSFIDREAAVSGRLHNRAAVLGDIARLRAAGIENLSVDLIAGLAGQNAASWQESLATLIDTGVPHASIYMLEVDQDSRLGREVLAHGARYHAELVPTDDAIAEMYSAAIERLGAAGLRQYEISNFSRPGFHSHHNLRYWQRRPYLGLGLDASSMLRATLPFHLKPDNPSSGVVALKGHGFSRAKREQNEDAALAAEGMCVGEPTFPQGLNPDPSFAHAAARLKPCPFKEKGPVSCPSASPHVDVLRTTTTEDLQTYLAGHAPIESAWLSPAQQHAEAWFLGLRLNAGVEIAAVEREFGMDAVAPAFEAVKCLVEAGLLATDGGIVRLTSRGQLLSNEAFQEFLAPEPELSAAASPETTAR